MNESVHAAISRNCTRKPTRSAVTLFSVGSDSRFSASKHQIDHARQAERRRDGQHPPGLRSGATPTPALIPPANAPRLVTKNRTSATEDDEDQKQHDAHAAEDEARTSRAILRREDRNRQAAQAHNDHMNRTSSETRIVPKSMPPSRKLIAMNGAIPAKSVASFTPCARSLPITIAAGRERASA